MKNVKSIGVFLAALAAGIAGFVSFMDEAEGAVEAPSIAMVMPTQEEGKWFLEQAYKVTSPTGESFACVVGEWDGNQETTYTYNNLECVLWNDPKSYLGYYEDGSLEPVK